MESIIFNYELTLSELLNTKVVIRKIINNKRIVIESLNRIKSGFGEDFQIFDSLQNREISTSN